MQTFRLMLAGKLDMRLRTSFPRSSAGLDIWVPRRFVQNGPGAPQSEKEKIADLSLSPSLVLPMPKNPQLLRHTQPCLCRQVLDLQQVVLQLEGFDFWKSHRQPSRQSKAQGGHLARRLTPRRDYARVLQLRCKERLYPRLHPCQE